MNRKPKRAGRPPAGGTGISQRAWFPFALIAVVSALAHGWCLGSEFFLDDLWQIRDNEDVDDGTWWQVPGLQWTYLWYSAIDRVFGMSPAWFHALNWMLHTATAFVLYASVHDYLGEKRDRAIALGGSLLFAAHPLGSEITNYARTQDIAWVTLFSLLAAWCFFRWLRFRRWFWLAATALCVAGAMFSKGPGVFHALMTIAVVAVGTLPHDNPRRSWRGLTILLGALAGVLVAAWLTGLFADYLQRFAFSMSDPRMGWHALTLCRVFWSFLGLTLFPAPGRLCADHHIAMTASAGDSTAWWALAGLVSWILFSVFLLWNQRTRLTGACLLLFAGAIVVRMLYLMNEFMPEYRIYPGLPWICVAFATGLHRIATRLSPRLFPVVTGVLVLVFSIISANRSFYWHDIERLAEDILQKYPTQARALWVMQRNDFDAGRWDRVLSRHPELFEIRDKLLRFNSAHSRRRELATGHQALAEVGCTGLYARALAETAGPDAGLREIDNLEQLMRSLRIEQSLHWKYFHHAQGLVLEKAGRLEEAAEALRKSNLKHVSTRDLQRVESKLYGGGVRDESNDTVE